MTKIVIRSRMPRPCCDDWNAAAVPENDVVMDDGSVARATLVTSSTAAPRFPFGGMLNEIVTDGSWPEWAMLAGPMLCSYSATSESGTRAPLALVMNIFESAFASSWSLGLICINTQYSLVAV